MADDLKRTAPEDPKKININQAWEVQYWCKVLGVTEDELREAVEAVGPMVEDVKAYLVGKRMKPRTSGPRM